MKKEDAPEAVSGNPLSVTPHLLIALVLTVLVLAPFLNKAFHIDDPTFLFTAKHLMNKPWDFYGLSYNWFYTESPMYIVNINPPLVCYFIAFAGYFLGMSEIALHAAFLLPAALLVSGVYFLARIYCRHPLIAALFALCAPVFILTATNVMCETTMAAFYVWAIVFWILGLEENRKAYLLYAALCIICSGLSKYIGISLLPLLAAYAVAQRKHWAVWAPFLLLSLAAFVAFDYTVVALYGKSPLFHASSSVLRHVAGKTTSRFVTGLSFTGGSFIAAGFLLPFLWKRSYRFWLCSTVLPAVLLLFLYWEKEWWLVVQGTVYIIIGIHILLLAAVELYNNRDGSGILIFLSILGTFIFASFVYIPGKYLLPMLPAVSLMITRRLEHNGYRLFRPRAVLLLVPALAVSLMTGWADLTWANTHRQAARMISEKLSRYPGNVYFQGHWGFQYYMEQAGFKAMDYQNTRLKDGDLVVIPVHNTNTLPLDYRQYEMVGRLQLKATRYFGVLNFGRWNSSFYMPGKTEEMGAKLPFTIHRLEPEVFVVLRFTPVPRKT